MDSRLVEEGNMFVAVKGTQTDGHAYIDKAIEKGAKVVKEKAEERIEAIKEFLEKKKGEAVGERPEFLEDLETEKYQVRIFDLNQTV